MPHQIYILQVNHDGNQITLFYLQKFEWKLLDNYCRCAALSLAAGRLLLLHAKWNQFFHYLILFSIIKK